MEMYMLNKKGFVLLESILLLEVVAIIVFVLISSLRVVVKEAKFEKNYASETVEMQKNNQ